MVLPYYLSGLVKHYTDSRMVMTVCEGLIRVGIIPTIYCTDLTDEGYSENVYVSWSRA